MSKCNKDKNNKLKNIFVKQFGKKPKICCNFKEFMDSKLKKDTPKNQLTQLQKENAGAFLIVVFIMRENSTKPDLFSVAAESTKGC